mmetsp:Transcript_24857/g.62418  ORF Transcript_24857/g.62418 Transcript_24857/m.62418 type:complete len:102 (+) Transcript_24857:85-390(+)
MENVWFAHCVPASAKQLPKHNGMLRILFAQPSLTLCWDHFVWLLHVLLSMPPEPLKTTKSGSVQLLHCVSFLPVNVWAKRSLSSSVISSMNFVDHLAVPFD